MLQLKNCKIVMFTKWTYQNLELSHIRVDITKVGSMISHVGLRIPFVKWEWVSMKRVRKTLFVGVVMMQSYPPRVLDRRLQEDWARVAKKGPGVLMNLRVDFWAHGPRLGPLFFVNIRIGFSFFWALYFGHSSSIRF